MPFLKPLPSSGFFAVIFCSEKGTELDGYEEMDKTTMQLAEAQPGFLGYESAGDGTKGIFVSYWETRDAIESWRMNATHQLAKSQARQWYKRYLSQVCLVESSNEKEFNF